MDLELVFVRKMILFLMPQKKECPDYLSEISVID